MLNVWFLEDSTRTRDRIRQVLQERFPNARVRAFDKWLELEVAWQSGPKPDAVILDLLVPDQHQWLIGLVRRSLVGRTRFVLAPARPLLAWIANRYGDRYLNQLQVGMLNRDREWGGVGFLLQRDGRRDLNGVKLYVYSITVNLAFRKYSRRFGRIASMIMEFVQPYADRLGCKVFPKGFYGMEGGRLTTELVNDGLPGLIEQMSCDFQVRDA